MPIKKCQNCGAGNLVNEGEEAPKTCNNCDPEIRSLIDGALGIESKENKGLVLVTFPVYVSIEMIEDRNDGSINRLMLRNSEDYREKLKNIIYGLAEEVLECSSVSPVIHDAPPDFEILID